MKRFLIGLIVLLFAVSVQAASVTYYGGAEEVSGSTALFETDNIKILVDCGSRFTDPEEIAKKTAPQILQQKETPFQFNPADINAVIVTHAHLDHIGGIPALFANGFRGDVYTTDATARILKIMLKMQISYESNEKRNWVWSERNKKRGASYFVAHFEQDCRWAKKIKDKKVFDGNLPALQEKAMQDKMRASPCKVCADIAFKPVLDALKVVDYNRIRQLSPDLAFEFLDAGHIPGSASVRLIFTKEEKKREIIFSGDLGSSMSRFHHEPDPPEAADFLFVEATYGASVIDFQPDEEYSRFQNTVGKTLSNRGIVWIPSFALDRTQRVLYEIFLARQNGSIPKNTRVYVPSPTANTVTALYMENPEWFKKGVSEGLAKIDAKTDKQNINADGFTPEAGSIIISTSAMMDRGLSAALIPVLINREDVLIAFVGYQNPQTLGGQIKNRAPSVTINNRTFMRKARVESFGCFSGHGDAADIDRWLANQKNSSVFLVHGEPDTLRTRKEDLIKKGFKSVFIASPGIRIEIE